MLLAALVAAGCGASDQNTTRGASQEYRAAQAVRAFLDAFVDSDGETACRLLTPERRSELTASTGQPTCDRAISALSNATREADLERLGRSRVTKVDLARSTARAEVASPAPRNAEGTHTVSLRKVIGRWKIASDFFAGTLAHGKAPTPPPGPPPNPVQERRVSATFERFRAALKRGDGTTGCKLRTRSARRDTVRAAIDLAGSRREAIKDFGELTCERVSVRVQPPGDKVRKVVVKGTAATLTLTGGATYSFRKIRGSWRVDS